jgi:hypothetical protein
MFVSPLIFEQIIFILFYVKACLDAGAGAAARHTRGGRFGHHTRGG